MHLTLFGEVQLFLLIAVTSASFLYWINHKYKSLNRQIIRAIDIPVYLLNRQGIVVKLLNTPTEKANRLPFLNPGVLNINNLVTDADECRKYMTSLLRVLNTRTSDSLTLKIRIESGEKLYIAVRMVYLNRNYVIASYATLRKMKSNAGKTKNTVSSLKVFWRTSPSPLQ